MIGSRFGSKLQWLALGSKRFHLGQSGPAGAARQTTPAGSLFAQLDTADAAQRSLGDTALGCEGIVSKRVGSRYVSGRTDNWIKVKNPEAPAVKREAEEDSGKI